MFFGLRTLSIIYIICVDDKALIETLQFSMAIFHNRSILGIITPIEAIQ